MHKILEINPNVVNPLGVNPILYQNGKVFKTCLEYILSK